MKSIIKILLIGAMLSGSMPSCKKEDSALIVVDNGDWKVSYFSDHGNELTDHFSGYTFHFDKDGKATAKNGAGTVVGSWTCGGDCNQLNMVLNYPSAPLNELNKNWHVSDQTIRVMQLQHINGGGGGNDFLTFKKK